MYHLFISFFFPFFPHHSRTSLPFFSLLICWVPVSSIPRSHFLRILIIFFSLHPPPSLPWPTIHIRELNLIIQLLRHYIHHRLQNSVVGRYFSDTRFPGRLREPRWASSTTSSSSPWFEVRRDGPWNAVTENNDEEEEEWDCESDGEEVCEDEVTEGESLLTHPNPYHYQQSPPQDCSSL